MLSFDEQVIDQLKDSFFVNYKKTEGFKYLHFVLCPDCKTESSLEISKKKDRLIITYYCNKCKEGHYIYYNSKQSELDVQKIEVDNNE